MICGVRVLTLCLWRKFYPMCFVCVLYAWAARGSGVTHTIPNLKGVGFLPGRVWLASSSYCYQATLITNSFILFTPKLWVAGWLAKLGEGQCFSLCQSSTPSRLPEDDHTWAGAWCRTGRLWAHRTPRQQGPRSWRNRRHRTRSRIRGVWSPQRLRFRLLHRHQLGHQNTRDLGSSSTPSWLTGVPQAESTDSPMSRSCTPRSLKCSTSPPQRYKTNPHMRVNIISQFFFFALTVLWKMVKIKQNFPICFLHLWPGRPAVNRCQVSSLVFFPWCTEDHFASLLFARLCTGLGLDQDQ